MAAAPPPGRSGVAVPPGTGGLDHPLRAALLAVAVRDGRFDSAGRSPERLRPVTEIWPGVERHLNAEGGDAVGRRITALSLAYRLGALGAPAIVAFLALDRLPDLRGENVLVEVGDTGRLERYAYGASRFFCLPDDPASAYPGAHVVPTKKRLREILVETYVDGWLEPLLGAVEQISPLNGKALWGMVASGWATSAAALAAVIGRSERAIGAVEAFIAADHRARRSSVAFYVESGPAGTAVRHWRGVCCLAYMQADMEKCPGECPLLPAGREALRRVASV